MHGGEFGGESTDCGDGGLDGVDVGYPGWGEGGALAFLRGGDGGIEKERAELNCLQDVCYIIIGVSILHSPP